MANRANQHGRKILFIRAFFGGALALTSFMVQAPTYTFAPTDNQIGFLADFGLDQQGFFDPLTAFTSVDVAGAAMTVATGVDGPGQIVEYDDHGVIRGVVDTRRFLAAIETPDNSATTVLAAAADQITGSSSNGGGAQNDFLDTSGFFSANGPPGGSATQAWGPVAVAQIAGSPGDASSVQRDFPDATAMSFTPIDVPPTTEKVAFGPNSVGEIVGTFEDSALQSRGFLDVASVLKTMDFQGAPFTEPLSTNARGHVIGASADSVALVHDFLDTSQIDRPGHFVMNDLGKNGSPQSVSEISGGRTSAPGDLSTPPAAAVPEPATLALLGLGLVALGFSRRRKLN